MVHSRSASASGAEGSSDAAFVSRSPFASTPPSVDVTSLGDHPPPAARPVLKPEHFSNTSGNDVEEPLVSPSSRTRNNKRINWAYVYSWLVNLALFGAKAYAWWISGSLAVLAAFVDSFVDLVSQLVIFLTDLHSRSISDAFPVGQARLETIGVLLCALIMALASAEIIEMAVSELYAGWVQDSVPTIHDGPGLYIILLSATIGKLLLFFLCSSLSANSEAMAALADDHWNDVLSNAAAAATAAVAVRVDNCWWVDGAGAIIISLYIVWRWFVVAKAQVDKIVGSRAPQGLVDRLVEIGQSHHASMYVDCIRAYYFGARFVVEMEVVMPITSTLREVHDVSLALQHKLEALEPIERAFVHVDYARRDQPEHRTERLLQGLPVLREESIEI